MFNFKNYFCLHHFIYFSRSYLLADRPLHIQFFLFQTYFSIKKSIHRVQSFFQVMLNFYYFHSFIIILIISHAHCKKYRMLLNLAFLCLLLDHLDQIQYNLNNLSKILIYICIFLHLTSFTISFIYLNLLFIYAETLVQVLQ